MTIFEFKAHIRRVIKTKVGGKTKLVVDISASARDAIMKIINATPASSDVSEPTPFSDKDGESVTWVSVKDVSEFKELVFGVDLNINVVMQARLQHWSMAEKTGWGLYLVGYTISSMPSNTIVRLDDLEPQSSSSSSSSSSVTPPNKRKPVAPRDKEPPKAPKKARPSSVSHSKGTPLSVRNLDTTTTSKRPQQQHHPLTALSQGGDLEDYTDGDEEWARAEMPDDDETNGFTQNIDLPSP